MFKEEDVEEDYVDSDFDADENEMETNNDNEQGDDNDEETERKRNVKRGVFTKAYKVKIFS